MGIGNGEWGMGNWEWGIGNGDCGTGILPVTYRELGIGIVAQASCL
ncbi:MAG: hypothetical protein QQW96_00700 [Tychonema bourrellyi B0820]|nr:hypothetical protein [Tychonema bourrellyi]MDQ2096156.1 hypothetical protein [Tychonema bourrellyi B0820]